MTYTRVNWVNSPSTSTPINATNLNIMDAGIANCLQNDGSVTASAATPLSLTLSGTDKVIGEWTATDGKHYQMKIRASDNALYFYDVTDSFTMFSLTANKPGPAGSFLAQTLPAAGSFPKDTLVFIVPFAP